MNDAEAIFWPNCVPKLDQFNKAPPKPKKSMIKEVDECSSEDSESQDGNSHGTDT